MPSDSRLFINREMSWLDFNQRVLDEALDPSVPLLERLGFLAITDSNLDEFFMIRVGGLETLAAAGISRRDPSGRTPGEQLRDIRDRVRRMSAAQYACWHDTLRPKLATAGIRQLGSQELTEEQGEHLGRVFDRELFPVVTPAGCLPDAPFPYLPDLTLHLAVRLRPREEGDPPEFAVLPVGRSLPRFLTLPGEGYSFALVEDAIRLFVSRFFPSREILETAVFRITRNADLGVDEDDAGDFLSEMQEVLKARKRSECVRLEVERSASPLLLSFLRKGLALDKASVLAVPGPVNLAAFRELSGIGGFESLKYEPWPARNPPEFDPAKSLFDQLRARNLLLLHPYDSFDPVVRLVEEAARDPAVLAVKQVLYRTSPDSPIVAALRTAAERGKSVTVLVELKARFDEARNIEWARQLEQAGAQVIYGVRGLKTHAKVCVVVRREAGGVARYVHLGTGNYNERTARLYSDVSFMTSREEYGADASAFFNAVCGYSEPQKLRRLVMAPFGLRARLEELIDGEAARAAQGQKALIMAKVNSLSDEGIVRALSRASQSGVRILLNVRGVCCLRPGLKGLTENITVVSIVDRYLEHSRILYFHQGGEDRVFISSADWMSRNLDRRIELLVPVEGTAEKRRLIATLETYFQDTLKSSRLKADGGYERVRPSGRRKRLRSQEALYRAARERSQQTRWAEGAVLEPIRPASRKGKE